MAKNNIKIYYSLMGLLVGLAFPGILIFLDLNQFGMEFTLTNIFEVIHSQRIHLFVLASSPLGSTIIGFLIALNKINNAKIIHQSKMAHIGEVAAGVGHEINNPLAICAGNLYLIKKDYMGSGEDNKIMIERLNAIEIGHERIEKIVNGLRTYARAMMDESEIFSVNDAIESTFNMVNEIYKKDGIDFSCEYPKEDLKTKGNMGEFQQVIMNLVSNAKDATKEKTYRKIIVKLTKSSDSKIQLEVRDNGCGIPENIKGKIMTPFFTTKEVGLGTGLGLGIANEIISQMGGFIGIDSEEGKGTTFTLILPLYEKNLSQEITQTQAQEN